MKRRSWYMRLIRGMVLSFFLVMSLSAREQVNVNFSKLEIKDFIKLVAKVTHKNILINNKIRGTVDFVSTTPVYKDELTGILISVLETKGFTLVRKGSLYNIVRSTEAAKNNLTVAKEGKKLFGSIMLTQVIKVKGENVDIIASKIRHLLSKTAKLVTVKESNLILITDYPKNIETIKKIIRDIDTNNRMSVKIFKIQHTDVKKLQTKLNNIVKSVLNQKISYDRVTIMFDENINALIVVGIPQNIKKIAAIIKVLDVKGDNSQRVEVFELKNSEAKSVLASLNAIIAKQRYSDPMLKPSISSSEEINSIIVVGKPMIIKGIKKIIDKLDKEKYQVYVKARIVEINNNDAKKIGLKYGLDVGAADASGLYSLAVNFGGSAIVGQVGGALSGQLVNSNGALSGVSKGLALGAALDFLQTKTAAKTVSTPSLLCVNNKESSIYVGKTISFQIGSTSNAVSGITNNYKRQDVGLTLSIKPRVSSKEKVSLKVKVKLENIAGQDANAQPITTKQNVQTEIVVQNGEKIIIGGLVKESNSLTRTKIPLLGDIPLLGNLFQHNDRSDTQTSLLVLLTPYIVDKSEKLSTLQGKLGELERLQQLYNKQVFAIIEKHKNKSDGNITKSHTQANIKNSIFGNGKSSR